MRIASSMLELRDAAYKVRCNIKRWNLTEQQAFELAREMELPLGRSSFSLLEQMKMGNTYIFDAKIRVKTGVTPD